MEETRPSLITECERMVLTPQKLYHEFRDWLISDSRLTWKTSRTEWTSAIKDFFCTLATLEGCQPICTRKGATEFLLDLVWIVEKPRKRLELGMEVELSGNPQRYLRAFDKLLHVKSNMKVGIFIVKKKLYNEIIDLLSHKVSELDYPISKEEYLVILLGHGSTRKRINIGGYQINIMGGKTKIEKTSLPFPQWCIS